MTDFNIYCDESRHTSDPTQPFMVIGAVRCPRERKHELVGQIHRLQARHNAHGELGRACRSKCWPKPGKIAVAA